MFFKCSYCLKITDKKHTNQPWVKCLLSHILYFLITKNCLAVRANKTVLLIENKLLLGVSSYLSDFRLEYKIKINWNRLSVIQVLLYIRPAKTIQQLNTKSYLNKRQRNGIKNACEIINNYIF